MTSEPGERPRRSPWQRPASRFSGMGRFTGGAGLKGAVGHD